MIIPVKKSEIRVEMGFLCIFYRSLVRASDNLNLLNNHTQFTQTVGTVTWSQARTCLHLTTALQLTWTPAASPWSCTRGSAPLKQHQPRWLAGVTNLHHTLVKLPRAADRVVAPLPETKQVSGH